MTRLTKPTYLNHRKQLVEQLHSDNNAFLMLNPADQWALHMYYLPTERLTDAELVAHREEMSFLDRSLPQRAGKAFARWNRLIPAAEAYVAARREAPARTKGAPTNLWIFSEMNPDLDADRIAKILLNMVREERERDQEDAAA